MKRAGSSRRIGQAVAAALVVAAVLVALRAVQTPPAAASGARIEQPGSATAEALDRCRLSDPDAVPDPACRAAWARARDAFFAPSASGDRS